MDYTKGYRRSRAKHEAKEVSIKKFARTHEMPVSQVKSLCAKGAYGRNARKTFLGWRLRDAY